MNLAQQRKIEFECMRLATAFAVFLDARRYADVVELFTADAVYRPRDIRYVGSAKIRGYLEARPESRLSRHVTSNLLVEVISATEAIGSSVLTYFVHDTQNAAPHVVPSPAINLVGDYRDRFILTPTGWRIAERIGDVLFIAS